MKVLWVIRWLVAICLMGGIFSATNAGERIQFPTEQEKNSAIVALQKGNFAPLEKYLEQMVAYSEQEAEDLPRLEALQAELFLKEYHEVLSPQLRKIQALFVQAKLLEQAGDNCKNLGDLAVEQQNLGIAKRHFERGGKFFLRALESISQAQSLTEKLQPEEGSKYLDM